MNKKQFFFFLAIAFLFIFVLLTLTYQESQSKLQYAGSDTGQQENTLILGHAEASSPPAVSFCPEDDCKTLVASLIQDSNTSIDCAIYDITSKDIADALLSEHRQGTKIRIVTDNARAATKTSKVGDLKSAGIDVLISQSKDSYMHNKFCVFDSKVSLVGSANFTDNSLLESYNNILVFEDERLAKVLEEKINSFYLGKFSDSSTVLGKDISSNFSVYFCPSNNCKNQIVSQISNAGTSIFCMVYSFTLDEFGDALLEAKGRGVDVKLVLESQQVTEYSEYQRLMAEGVEVILEGTPYLMHNKFCVFDNYTLVTGSMNFSYNGINNNDETLLVISDSNLARAFLSYFQGKLAEWNSKPEIK